MVDIRCSIVIAVLKSYDPLRRQLRYFEQFLPADWDVLIMDDGSDPPITENPRDYNFRLHIIPTGDYRPWTQPAARNLGVALARGRYIYLTDIDHIVTPEVIQYVNAEDFIRMEFVRKWGVLEYKDKAATNSEVELRTDWETLERYGLRQELMGRESRHFNSFAMPKAVFLAVGGYDEKFCGKYGGDDVNFANRYSDWVKEKTAGQAEQVKEFYRVKIRKYIYVYPDPRKDKLKLFHDLRLGKV